MEIYHMGTRINIGIFFKIVGAPLMVFAAGLLVDAGPAGTIVQNAGSTSIDSNKPAVRRVNGRLRPVLTMLPGETQLWRLADEGADIFYVLQLKGYHFTVVGEGCYPVVLQVTSADTLLLPPGKRYDVLVTAATQQCSAWLRTVACSNGPQGDSYPQVNLLELNVTGQPETPLAMPSGGRSTAPADLADAPIAQKRTVTLSENSDRTVMSINGVPKPYTSGQDTIPAPDEQNGVPGQVVIHIPFNDFPGRWMFHCHIAAHEDAEMISFINVVPAAAPRLDELGSS
jgi:suppressor of ftsI